MGLLRYDDIAFIILPANHHEENESFQLPPVGFISFGNFVDKVFVLDDDFLVLLNKNGNQLFKTFVLFTQQI